MTLYFPSESSLQAHLSRCARAGAVETTHHGQEALRMPRQRGEPVCFLLITRDREARRFQIRTRFVAAR